VGLQCWSLMDVDIRECLTACPTSAASLSPASFRFALALRLCFNSIGLHRGDFNPQAAGHVRHTGSRCAPQLRRLSTAHVQGLVRRPVRRVGLNSSLTFGRSCDDHAGSRRLAEAGCSASEIAAITGHKPLAEVERYTRAADQERLARQAMQRQSESRSGKLPVDEVANTTDQTLEINSLIARLALPRGLEPLFSP